MELKKVAIAAALVVASASANAVEFWENIPTNGTSVVGTLDNDNPFGIGFSPVTLTVGANNRSTTAGQFFGEFWTSGTETADAFFRFFCAEIGVTTNTSPELYRASTIIDDEIAKLYDVGYPNPTAGDFWDSVANAQTNFGAFTSADAAAAFQVALWNLLLDNDLTLAGGNFRWNGPDTLVSIAAQALLDAVANYGDETGYTRWTLYYFSNPLSCTAGTACTGKQDYFSAIYRAPEPGSLALFGLVLAGLGMVSRRRKY